MPTTQPPVTLEAARAVLDAAGQLMAFAREDGSSLLREQSRAARHVAPSTWASAAEALPPERQPTPRSSTQQSPRPMAIWCPAAGGVLVRDDGDDVIGAVGVSGSLPDDDEACAVAGIAAAGLGADPGA
jgi:uncharacterized protein GlcG (DUF336 family)